MRSNSIYTDNELQPEIRSFINKNFYIKINSSDKKDLLIGAGRMHRYTGVTWSEKIIKKVLNKCDEKTEFKIYGKMKITFYPK